MKTEVRNKRTYLITSSNKYNINKGEIRRVMNVINGIKSNNPRKEPRIIKEIYRALLEKGELTAKEIAVYTNQTPEQATKFLYYLRRFKRVRRIKTPVRIIKRDDKGRIVTSSPNKYIINPGNRLQIINRLKYYDQNEERLSQDKNRN